MKIEAICLFNKITEIKIAVCFECSVFSFMKVFSYSFPLVLFLCYPGGFFPDIFLSSEVFK